MKPRPGTGHGAPPAGHYGWPCRDRRTEIRCPRTPRRRSPRPLSLPRPQRPRRPDETQRPERPGTGRTGCTGRGGRQATEAPEAGPAAEVAEAGRAAQAPQAGRATEAGHAPQSGYAPQSGQAPRARKPVVPAEAVTPLIRGIAVLQRLTEADGTLTPSELERATGLARSTVDRIATTLTRMRYVRQDGRDVTLAPRLMDWAMPIWPPSACPPCSAPAPTPSPTNWTSRCRWRSATATASAS
ncbi:helix-turn-helix domain-containing protein [Streptomyces sp. NPDC006997]|uniref:helix-turn-helix domain-containing protein n=1 Tax=Streptomyces sp. NPDC006997 TaxID=3155356 RepID=UPI0033DEC87E